MGIAEVFEAAAGCCSVEIDDCEREAVAEDEVAWREIVVADRFMLACERRPRGGVVEAPD
jgi:hypothetical protein